MKRILRLNSGRIYLESVIVLCLWRGQRLAGYELTTPCWRMGAGLLDVVDRVERLGIKLGNCAGEDRPAPVPCDRLQVRYRLGRP
jgi:hypothetical protein